MGYTGIRDREETLPGLAREGKKEKGKSK